jgi:hypothetical protein
LNILRQIFQVFAFGKVRHEQLSPLLHWGPLFCAAAAALVFFVLPIPPKLTGDGSLSRHMITVFSIMPGFYIAALAAVATFNRDEMDLVMPDPAPELKLSTRGRSSWVKVTFRMFTSHLFSYLTAMSFSAVFFFVAADLTAPSIDFVFNNYVNNFYFRLLARLAYVATAAWIASKIVVTTMIGLYFLAERMHRPHA